MNRRIVIAKEPWRPRQIEQRDQFGQEQLVVGKLAAAGARPAGEEGIDGGGGWGHGFESSPSR